MNSLILCTLGSFFKGFWALFKQSGIYKIFTVIYNGISKSWAGSRIVNKCETDSRDGEAAKSIVGRFFYLPFRFLNFLNVKIGKSLAKNIENSRICNIGRMYVQNFMSLNTRFFGVMLLCASLSYAVVKFASAGVILKTALIAAAVGAVLSLFDFNIMGFGNTSGVVSFFKSCAGFRNLDFHFYDDSFLKGKLRIVIAVAVGIITGIAVGLLKIYGAAVPFALFGMLVILYFPLSGIFFAAFSAAIIPTMVLAGICLWTVISVIISSFTKSGFKWRVEGVGTGIALFLGVLLFASLTSFTKVESLTVWLMYLLFAGFFFIIINTVETKEQLFAILKVFVLSGLIVAAYGILQYIFGWKTSNSWIDETMFEDETMRVYSTLQNPNVLGEYLILVLPVAAIFMIKENWNRLAKWAYMAIFAVLAVCLILTQSRGCWIGAMVAVFIFICFYNGKWWGLLPIFICILPFIIPESIITRFTSVGDTKDTSTLYRVYIWLGTIAMMKHFWISGIGMGEAPFAAVYPFFSYNAIVAPHSHNTYLQLLVAGGICALAVFVVLMIVFLLKMHTAYKSFEKRSPEQTTVLAISCGIIAFLIQSMFDYTFYNYRVMAIFFMLMGFGIALKNMKSKGGILNCEKK